MPVSYVSQTFRNSPYVPPVDLSLMAKVLSYKQGQFDQEAEKLQNQVNQMSSLDVVKGEDRQYLNNKINNLVGNINGMGGVDLGDLNVGNQIESYGSEIYNDPKIINAISSTKQIRNLQDSYEKMRTDPKMSKYYSDANYTLDMANVNSYVNDGQVGSSYNGNSSATPYYDYNKEFNDTFKTLKANEYSQITPDGYYIRKSDGKYISQQDVMDEARGMMSMNARSQMGRDATYLYKYKAGYGKDEVVSKALDIDNQHVDQLLTAISKTTSDLQLEKDPTNKIQLQNNLADYKSQLQQAQSNVINNKERYDLLYDNNPDELMYKAYSDDYFKALGARYSVNQVKNDLVADPVKKMLFDAGEHRYLKQIDINAADSMLDKKLKAEQDNLILEYQLKAGLKSVTSSGNIVAGSGNPEEVVDIQPNTQTGKEDDYYDAAKERVKNGITGEVNKATDDFWARLVANNPELQAPEFKVGSQSQSAVSGDTRSGFEKFMYSSGLQSLDPNHQDRYKPPTTTSTVKQNNINPNTYDFNKDGRIDFNDFEKKIYSTQDKKWHLGYQFIQDAKAREIVANAVQAVQNKAAGKPVNISKLPKGASDLVEKLSLLNQEKTSLNLGIAKYDAGDKAFLRDQYGAKIISSDEKVQGSSQVGTIKSFLLANGLTSNKNVVITEVGKNTDGTAGSHVTFSEVSTSGKAETKSVPLPDNIASVVGVQSGPYDVLNTTVNQDNPFVVPVQSSYDPNFVVNVKVYQDGNDKQFMAAYMYVNPQTGQTSQIDLPIDAQSTPALAYGLAKKFIEQDFYSKTLPVGQYKQAFDKLMLNK